MLISNEFIVARWSGRQVFFLHQTPNSWIYHCTVTIFNPVFYLHTNIEKAYLGTGQQWAVLKYNARSRTQKSKSKFPFSFLKLTFKFCNVSKSVICSPLFLKIWMTPMAGVIPFIGNLNLVYGTEKACVNKHVYFNLVQNSL